MTFQEWFNSAPHRAKYDSDHPAYLAAREAWDAAHEACAKAVEDVDPSPNPIINMTNRLAAAAIRARGQS